MSIHSEKWFNPSEGEEVLWYSHPSLIMRLPQLLSGVIMAFFAAVAAVYLYVWQDLPIEIIGLVVAMIPFCLAFSGYQLLRFKNTWYVITNRRIIQKTQILGRGTTSNPHREITRVDISVDAFEWFINKITGEDIGDMIVRTADDSGETAIIENIPEIGLAESYVERLTGTGPDTPARYDAEEREKHQQEQARKPPEGGRVQETQSEQNAISADSPESLDDEADNFDEFEPSENA